ncbi:hypothetical protein [Egbenema bharatensis]|uniref:hypothetical protein n=1 Tax=Egbenema bharatensis TaxID=3463334 RepID=UPI003A89D141
MQRRIPSPQGDRFPWQGDRPLSPTKEEILNHCRDCNVFSPEGCAVNPGYWKAQHLLSKADKDFRQAMVPAIKPCPDWELSEPKTLSLTLPETSWRLSVDRNCPSEIAKTILYEIEKQIRSQLGLPPGMDSDYDDIPF